MNRNIPHNYPLSFSNNFWNEFILEGHQIRDYNDYSNWHLLLLFGLLGRSPCGWRQGRGTIGKAAEPE
jgi:hypothetical protein